MTDSRWRVEARREGSDKWMLWHGTDTPSEGTARGWYETALASQKYAHVRLIGPGNVVRSEVKQP